jgi:hypothetical protein
MSAEALVQRLRRFLLWFSAAIMVTTPVELWFMDHYQERAQMIPFVLCVLGLFAIGAVLVRPTRLTAFALRGTMTLVAAGSLLGIVLHLVNNFQFELEIRPNAAVVDVIGEALKGASPLLAPGILALGALLALTATLYHPALAVTTARRISQSEQQESKYA